MTKSNHIATVFIIYNSQSEWCKILIILFQMLTSYSIFNIIGEMNAYMQKNITIFFYPM